MLLTGIAWGIAYAPSIASAVRLPLIFVFVHFLAISVVVATAAFFLVGRLLGPGIAGLPGRRRQQGLFTPIGEGESLEFGYCFDVRQHSSTNSFEASARNVLTIEHAGRNTSVFPGVGDALCCTIPIVALNIARLLVRLLLLIAAHAVHIQH